MFFVFVLQYDHHHAPRILAVLIGSLGENPGAPLFVWAHYVAAVCEQWDASSGATTTRSSGFLPVELPAPSPHSTVAVVFWHLHSFQSRKGGTPGAQICVLFWVRPLSCIAALLYQCSTPDQLCLVLPGSVDSNSSCHWLRLDTSELFNFPL